MYAIEHCIIGLYSAILNSGFCFVLISLTLASGFVLYTTTFPSGKGFSFYRFRLDNVVCLCAWEIKDTGVPYFLPKKKANK